MRFFSIATTISLATVSLVTITLSAKEVDQDVARFTRWAAMKSVFNGPAKSIGSYDAGCLSGAEKLDREGTGFVLMRPSRKRFFVHPQMKAYVHALGERLQSDKMPVLLVGDASGPRGGPFRNGHASHQTGLDLDVWFRTSKQRPNRREREHWSAPSFVTGRKSLKKNWSKAQTDLLIAAVSFDTVNRIFVSPPIKKYFCENFRDSEWLYKIRPWWGHEEHFHVRLNCPTTEPECTPQPALNPKDNGCGSDLDWWYSQEADEKWAEIRKDRTPRTYPQLPDACTKMVN